jgi:hypothetical protein
MNCDICGLPAEIHMTEVSPIGARERHLCETHAAAEGIATPADSAIVAERIHRLRAIIEFAKANGRMPTGAELERLGGVGNLSSTQPESEEFVEQIAYLEAFIEFVERYGRFPSEHELPDPF